MRLVYSVFLMVLIYFADLNAATDGEITVLPIGLAGSVRFDESMVKYHDSGKVTLIGNGVMDSRLENNPELEFSYHLPLDPKTEEPLLSAKNMVFYAPYLKQAGGAIFARKELFDLAEQHNLGVYTIRIKKDQKTVRYCSYRAKILGEVIALKGAIAEHHSLPTMGALSVIGESLGGIMAYQLALYYPEAITSVAMVGTTSFQDRINIKDKVPALLLYTMGDYAVQQERLKGLVSEWRNKEKPYLLAYTPPLPSSRATQHYAHTPHALAYDMMCEFTVAQINDDKTGYINDPDSDFLSLSTFGRVGHSSSWDDLLEPQKSQIKVPASWNRLPELLSDTLIEGIRVVRTQLQNAQQHMLVVHQSAGYDLIDRRDTMLDLLAYNKEVTACWLDPESNMAGLASILETIQADSALIYAEDLPKLTYLLEQVRKMFPSIRVFVVLRKGNCLELDLTPLLDERTNVVWLNTREKKISGKIYLEDDLVGDDMRSFNIECEKQIKLKDTCVKLEEQVESEQKVYDELLVVKKKFSIARDQSSRLKISLTKAVSGLKSHQKKMKKQKKNSTKIILGEKDQERSLIAKKSRLEQERISMEKDKEMLDVSEKKLLRDINKKLREINISLQKTMSAIDTRQKRLVNLNEKSVETVRIEEEKGAVLLAKKIGLEEEMFLVKKEMNLLSSTGKKGLDERINHKKKLISTIRKKLRKADSDFKRHVTFVLKIYKKIKETPFSRSEKFQLLEIARGRLDKQWKLALGYVNRVQNTSKLKLTTLIVNPNKFTAPIP